jgi:hypothetical protein
MSRCQHAIDRISNHILSQPLLDGIEKFNSLGMPAIFRKTF